MRRLKIGICTVAFFVGIAVMYTAGCGGSLFNKTTPSIVVSGETSIGREWSTISPPVPLLATGKIQVIGLKIGQTSGLADKGETSIRLNDGRTVKFDVELIGEDGTVTALFPNGFAEAVEFGKRAANRENVEESYFRIGERFRSVRIRSDIPMDVREITWVELDL